MGIASDLMDVDFLRQQFKRINVCAFVLAGSGAEVVRLTEADSLRL
jgi:hypothetical protein